MKKYWLVHMIFIIFLLAVSCFTWGTPYSHAIQVVGFVLALGLAMILLYIIRDEFLRNLQKVDKEAYKRAVNTSAYDKSYRINIDKNYPYNEEAQELIHWWSQYTWITFATVIIPFVLLLLSDY